LLQSLTNNSLGLVGDAGALSISGEAATPGLLAFIEGFGKETDYLVWSSVLGAIGTVKSIFSEDEELAKALKKFTLKLIDEAVQKIGWEFSPKDDFLTTQLRSLLIITAGLNDHPGYDLLYWTRKLS